VHGGVLPHVQPAQVEAEDLDGLAQAAAAGRRPAPGAVAAQRGVDDVEVGAQLVGRLVGRQRGRPARPGHRPSTAGAVAASRAEMPRSARR
jgi:hypothetical protein